MRTEGAMGSKAQSEQPSRVTRGRGRGSRPSRNGRLLLTAACAAAGAALLLSPPIPAFEIPPLGSPVFVQTSGAQTAITIGDWYTSTANGSVSGFTYITIHVPSDWPNDQNLHIDLFSPEMNAGNVLDEQRGTADTSFFELYDAGTLVSLEVIDGLLDANSDRSIGTDDDGTLFVTGDANGIAVIDGFVDVNDDSVIDATDDGTFAGFSIIDGYVDVDGDTVVPEATDDDYLWATPSPGTPTVAHAGNDSCLTTSETASLVQCRYLAQAGAGTWKRAATLTAPVATGRYVLRGQTGDRSGTATVNDDDNSWRLRVGLDDDADPTTAPPANTDNPDTIDGTNDELVIGLVQVTYQHAEATNQTLTLYEFVPKSQPSIGFHNFDVDGNVSVTYIAPSGGSTAGTVSGNGVWNNGGTATSRAGDTILTPEEGWWQVDTLFTPNNQIIQEGRTSVPGFFEQPPTPIVEVTKDDGQSRVAAGNRVTWTITFSNVSDDPAKNMGVTPGAAVNLVLTDTVPVNTTYVGCGITAPFTGTCSESGGVVTYTINEALIAGGSGSVTLTVDVSPTATGVVFNEVTIDFEDSANVATFDVETDADVDLLPGTCFAAARGPNAATVDRLIAIDRTGGSFLDIGPTTGATDIRAVAFEPGTDTLFSVDSAAAGGPTLGTHDITTAAFTAVGGALTTCTAAGPTVRTLLSVEGLSFDPVNANLWASASTGNVVGAPDVLFQLDPTTGALVPNLFGPGLDCLDLSLGGSPLNTVEDIAVDPTGAPFYASDGAQLYTINTTTGAATPVGPFGAGTVTDMAGMGFNNSGNLSGTTGAGNTPAANNDELWSIDLTATPGAATSVYDFKTAPSVYTDYEALDCLTDSSNRIRGVVFNDLNVNGLYDPATSDVGQGGVTVRLWLDNNNDGLVDGGDTQIQSTTTAADGTYGFFVGVPGNYVVDTVYPGTYPATAVLTTDNVEEADFTGTGETDVGNNFGFSLPSDLAATKTSNATGDVVAGQTIVYTITITNPAGPLQTGITVSDPVPAGTSYNACTINAPFTGTCSESGGIVSYTINESLNNAGTIVVTLTVVVENPLDYTRGQILNIATVDSNQSPPVQPSVSDPLSQGGSIGDRVWLDLDGDGIQDVGEPGLANVTVQLVQVVGAPGGADDVVVATTQTSLDGSYTFTGIAPGTYYVNVVDADIPTGLVRSPGNGNADPTDGPPLGAPGRTFTIAAEEDYRDADFGYRPADGTAVVGDLVWIDAGDDGKQDPGEPGVGGVTLDLVNARTGAVVASTTTTGDGRYLFTNVATGKYRVDVTDTASVLTSYTLTNGPQSSKDPTVPLNIAPGESYLRADFGYFKSGLLSISDDVWLDTNANGLRDPTEQGVAGVTVNLVRTYGIIDGKVDIDRDGAITTADDGFFEGFAVIDGVLDLDGDGTAGEVNGDDDGTIGGITVDDGLLDLDGDATAGETNGDDSGTFTGQIIASTVTDANGEFTFSGLENGNYEIVIEDKAGKLKGKRGTTSAGLAKRLSRSLAGADLDDESFGYANSGQVTGVIWRDVDGDGIRDAGEAGVPGVTVELRDGVCTPGVDCPTTTTDASGGYSFDGLAPGSYTVVVTDGASVLTGSSQTGDPDETGTCSTCDGQGAAGVGSTSGPSVDFGYQNTGLADISGTVFDDLDADGVEEAGEGGIAGVTLDLVPVYAIINGRVDVDGDGSITAADDGSIEGITVIDGGLDVNGDGTVDASDDGGFVNGFTVTDGVLDLDGDGLAGEINGDDTGTIEGQAVASTTTDANGDYLFADVLDGDYKVKVTDTAGLLDGYTLTSGLDEIDVTVAGANLGNIDFGYVAAVETGSIGDSIFFDVDRDGQQDSGEPGIAGVTVELGRSYAIVDGQVDVDRDGTIDSADDGVFESFAVIDGRIDVTGNGVVDASDDGSVNGVAIIDGYLDLDGDGNLPAPPDTDDDNPTFIASVVASTTTDASGSYVFSGLPPGEYSVDVTDLGPDGLPSSGDEVLTGLAVTAGSDPTAVIPLTSGESYVDADIGYAPSSGSAIGDTIFYDLDPDGVGPLLPSGTQGPGEVGISGVTVKLWDPGADQLFGGGDDTLLGTTVTDASGYYLFTGVAAGKRYVEVDTTTLPGGYGATPTNGAAVRPYEVLAGEDILIADFGFTGGTPGSIGDRVYRDDNGNSAQEAGEPGIGGVTLDLVPTYAVIDGQIDVDRNGTIDGADDGRFEGYDVVDGRIDVDGSGGGDAADDATVNGVAIIDGYLDIDGDGNPTAPDGDDDNPAFTGQVIASTTTGDGTSDANGDGTIDSDDIGYYRFVGVPAGTYDVVVTDVGSVLVGLNGTEAPASPFSILADGSPGDTVTTADFGFAPSGGTGTIGGTVWHDTNQTAQSGVLDVGESGMELVVVELWLDVNGNGTIEPATDNLVRTATTDENGDYEFLGVPFGSYLVQVNDSLGVLRGFTGVAGPSQVTDSHGKNQPFAVTLSGATPRSAIADFAYEATGSPSSIEGTVFFDANDNAVLDSENGYEGTTLYLYRDLDGDGILDPTDPRIGVTVSDANGDYSFTDLPGGLPADNYDYLVVADPTRTFLGGLRQTTQQTQPQVGIQRIDNLAAGTSLQDQDFGYTIQTTSVLVSEFGAVWSGGGVVVRFETASQVGTMGFYVYRWEEGLGEYVQVNERLLPAVMAPQGAVYELVDPGASDGALRYALVEVEAGGAERTYGPFEVVVSGSVEPLAGERRLTPRVRPARPVADERAGAVRPVRVRSERLRLTAAESGLVRLSAGEMAAALGGPPGRVRSALARGRLELTRGGEPVAWRRDGDGIVFYAAPSTSVYSPEAVYWLSFGPGLEMRTVRAGQAVAGAASESWAVERYETDAFAVTVVTSSDEDVYYWQYLSAGDPRWGRVELTLEVPEVVAAEARLVVEVHSMTSTPATAEHELAVAVNGAALGSVTWDGSQELQLEYTVPSGVLVAGENTVELTAVLGEYVPYSVLLVDAVEVGYVRRHRALGGYLELGGASGPVVVEGLVDREVMVVDVTDPFAPQWLAGVTVVDDGTAVRAAFVAGPERRYAVSSRQALGSVTVEGRPAPGLMEGAGAEYVVVAPAALAAGAAALAEYRTASGLTTLVVDVEQVFDDYGHGIATPAALAAFLAAAWDEWPVAPRWAVLVGKGTFDSLDVQGAGDNLVPPLLVPTPQGMFASDVLLGDVEGDDGVPEIAVGRIPATTDAEVEAYVARLAASEAAGAGIREVVLLADNADPAGDFPVDSDGLVAHLPAGATSERIYLSEQPLAAARTALFSALAAGADWVNYLGHGGVDRLAGEGLVTAGDAAALPEATRLPVVTSLTCSVGRFELPGWQSLGEALVLAPQGGAAAVWAPSGQSYHFEAVRLNAALFDALATGNAGTVGEVVLETLDAFEPILGFEYLPSIYNLLGDPAYRARWAR